MLTSLESDLNTKFAEHVNLCLDQRGIHHEFSNKLEAFANATNKTMVELTANFITLSKELEETQKQNNYLWNLNSELQTLRLVVVLLFLLKNGNK